MVFALFFSSLFIMTVCALRQPPHNISESRFPHRKYQIFEYTHVCCESICNRTCRLATPHNGNIFRLVRIFSFHYLPANSLTHTIAHRELDNQLFFLVFCFFYFVVCRMLRVFLLLHFVTTYGARTRTRHTHTFGLLSF